MLFVARKQEDQDKDTSLADTGGQMVPHMHKPGLRSRAVRFQNSPLQQPPVETIGQGSRNRAAGAVRPRRVVTSRAWQLGT